MVTIGLLVTCMCAAFMVGYVMGNCGVGVIDDDEDDYEEDED